MKSMKYTEEDKKEMATPNSALDRPSYPYGLKIHLDEEAWEKLGKNEAPEVGKEFMILAKAVVEDVSQNKRADDQKNISVGLQITDMDIKEAEEEKSTETVLYGG